MFSRKNKQSAKAAFEQFLKKYNCDHTVEHEDNNLTYHFEFQAARFVASVREQNDCVEITYPCMATTSMSHLELVRAKCNERNLTNILFKFSYSLNHEQNEVNIHVSFFNNRFDSESMAYQLKVAFYLQREWLHEFDEALRESNDLETSDLESELYKHQREMFLLRRMEMNHQQTSDDSLPMAGTGPLSLWQLLETVSPLPQSQLLALEISARGGVQRLDDEQSIRNFDLRHALVEGSGQDARLELDHAVLTLKYKQGLDEHPRLLTVTLTAEGEDDHSLYTRVTVAVVPRNAGRMNSLSNENRQPLCVSLLIALDRASDKQRQAEFEYMWSDAKLKAGNGESKDLTQEQMLLSQVHVADVAYNLYWGEKLFNNGRYYEAIQHLENVYGSYRAFFFEMPGDHKREFMELAYKLGFAYNELGLSKQAFYYLDLMASDGNIRHSMEFINSLAGSKDMRIFSYTDGVMEDINKNFDSDDMPDGVREFCNFLRRRRGYAYIDFNQLDKAEEIFTAMLDEEENADFAINELAYIKKLRKQRLGLGPAADSASQGIPDKPF